MSLESRVNRYHLRRKKPTSSLSALWAGWWRDGLSEIVDECKQLEIDFQYFTRD